MTDRAKEILKMLMDTILDLVDEFQEGVPSGTVYSAMMTYGISLDTYQAIVEGLVTAKKITVKNHCLYPVKGE